jgi:MFS family permease
MPSCSLTGKELMQAQKGFWSIWIATLLFFAAFYALMIPLPLYLDDVGLPDWQIGAILGALGITSLIARPLAGVFADTHGRKPVMLFGTGALVVGAIGVSVTTQVPVLFGMRISQALGYVAFTTAATAWVTDLALRGHRAAALALFGTAANIAMTFTPAIVGAVLGVLTLKGAFWLAAALAAIGGVLALQVKEPPSEKQGPSPGSLFVVVQKLLVPILTAMLFGIGFGAFLQFLPLLVERRGLGAAGIAYTVYGIGIIGTRLTTGRLLDGSRRTKMLPIAFVLLCLGLCGYAFAGSNIQLLTATLMVAVASGILHPLLIAVHVEKVSRNERGRASAVFYLGFDLGIGLGAWILAPVLQSFGLTGLYLLAALAAVVGIIPAWQMLSLETAPSTLVTKEGAQRN